MAGDQVHFIQRLIHEVRDQSFYHETTVESALQISHQITDRRITAKTDQGTKIDIPICRQRFAPQAFFHGTCKQRSLLVSRLCSWRHIFASLHGARCTVAKGKYIVVAGRLQGGFNH